MARFTVTRFGTPRADTTRLAAELSLYLVESAELDARLLVGVSLHAQAGDAKAVTNCYAAGGLAAPRWSGGGLEPLGFCSGESVDPEELRVLLTGRNPRTGERIISASGSHARRHLRVGTPSGTRRPQHHYRHPDRPRRLQRCLGDRIAMSPLMQEVHSPPQPHPAQTR